MTALTRPDDGAAGAAPSARLRRLRSAMLAAPYALCTQKAELLTAWFRRAGPRRPLLAALARAHFAATRRSLAQNLGTGSPQPRWLLAVSRALQALYAKLDGAGGEPPVVRFARGLEHVLAHMPLAIYDDELIVGNLSSQRIGAPIHPDLGGLLMLPELEGLATRAVNPLRTTREQVARLQQEILPFWFPRSVLARAPIYAEDPELQNKLLRGRDFILTQFAGISHVTPSYPAVVERGFTGLLADVEAARAHAQDDDGRATLEAMAIVCRAAIAYGERWSRHCAAEAERAADPVRTGELRRLAAIFARVPAQPARTFHEAVQSLFIAHVIVHQESFQHGVSFGRVDQYLWPYFERDLREGRLSRDEAVELVGCFLVKAAEQLPLFNAMATEYFSGLSSASGLTLGGTDAEGRDLTNELSFVFLDAYDLLRLRQPNLHARVHPGTPAAFLDRCHEVIKKGGGMPALFNDARVVPALESCGAASADARNYAIVGCVEWGVPYKSFPAAGAVFVSLPAVLDRVLHGGVADGRGRAPASFASMDELHAAFVRELEATIAAAAAGNDAIETAHARHRPTPFLSVLVEGCIASGRDVTAGGAVYDTTGMQGVGLADVADSLTAIEQLVFRDGTLDLRSFIAAVDANFAGHEHLRRRILGKAAKYGEDTGAAEAWVRRLAADWVELVHRRKNVRGGTYEPGFWAMTTHVGFGRRLGALPSGRLAGQPLADGISPVNGADRFGPTASMMAATAAAAGAMGNGVALNEKLAPWFVAGSEGTALMTGLTRGYFAAGGMQVQYNVLDPAVLLDAKQHPERYRDLVVRISGYSAYFNDLTEAMKDDLIARTLHDAGRPVCQVPAT